MPYTFRTSDLPKLDLDTDRGTDFLAWHQQWLAYRSLSGLGDEPAQTQVQALHLCFSRETLNIMGNLGLTDAQKQDQAEIIAALRQHVEGKINETVERRNLRQRTQLIGESFDDFLVALRELAKTCNFCNNDCLQIQDLTLDAAVTKCRGLEAAKRSRSDIKGSAEVNAVRRTPAPMDSRKQDTHAPTCTGCGNRPHVGGRKNCPAQGKSCNRCGKVGHFGRVCRQSRSGDKKPQTNSLRLHHTSDHPAQLSNLKSLSSEPAPTIRMQVVSPNGQASMEVLPDSGADICAAGPDFIRALGEHMDNLAVSNVVPRAVNGTSMRPAGKLPGVMFQIDGRSSTEDVHIYPSVSGVLISWTAARKLNILPECYPKTITSVKNLQSQKTPSGTQVTAEQIMAEFPTVFDGRIRTMPGEKFQISLADNARPFCVNTPRTIPFAHREKLQKEIDLLISQGIIAPVTEPTEWCAPIVVVPKKNSNRIRMCVDLSKLNKFVRRERYPSVTPAEAVADITQAKARFFTVFDALKGYHQVPLDEESQLLTTFITPCGRFKFLRAPYGICSISEHYNRRMDEAFAGMVDFRKIVDDVVVFDQDQEQHRDHVRAFLRRCEERLVSLNAEKFRFCQTETSFAGFTLSSEGYAISSEITDAISNFPTPSSRTDLRSFFGLANQLATSTNNIAAVLSPLRPLLSSKNDFLWTPVHDEAFAHATKVLATAPTLAFFDARKETRLYTDASTLGIGFILLQKAGDEWKIIQAGSRFLTDTEGRYAVIELECLAVAWAIKKCNIFLSGMAHFTVVTDHNPLIPILNTHRLDEIQNPRLQRLRTRLMGYNFTAQWLKGIENEAADALSRHPFQAPVKGDDLAEYDITVDETQEADVQALSISEVRTSAVDSQDCENLHLQELREHANGDSEYQDLKDLIKNGFPDQKSTLKESLKKFWSVKDNLSIDEGFVVYGCRLFIPTSLRAVLLSRLHEAHQGISRSQARARLTIYWPGIDSDIEHFVQGCKHCQDRLPSNVKEPMISKPLPERPFQQIAADFASCGGKEFLIVVDCRTDWPDIIEMGKDTSSARLIEALRNLFCRTAVPDLLWSDRGPQFTSSQLASFLTTWGVSHEMSSPRYPQSNGKVEATVKSMKQLISAATYTGRSVNWDKLCRSLLQYRNTPCRRDGLSPAQKLFGRPIQDHLPAHRRSFAPEWQKSSLEADATAQEVQCNTQDFYNQHSQNLSDLNIGSHVAVQHPVTKLWEIYGIVTAIGSHRRYFVKTQSGRVLVRNRRFLRKRIPISIAAPASVDPPCMLPQQPPAHRPRRSTRLRKRPQRLIEHTT